MEIGIISVRDSDYHPNGRLIQAAAEKGHHGRLIHPYQVWPHTARNGLCFEGKAVTKSLDVVMPRQGATIGESSLTLLYHFKCLKMPMVNGFNAVCIARSQIMTLQTLTAKGLPVPETVFVNSKEGFHGAVPLVGGYPVVAKQASGRQGAGIYLVKTKTEAKALINDHMTPSTGILVQRYLPTQERLDIRVMVIGGRAVGAMEMTPLEGDFRANYHLTRESRLFKITPPIENLAIKAACTVGLDIAGVDVIVDRHQNMYLIEVNYAPGFKGLEKATGLDIAGLMIDCAAAKGRRRENRSQRTKPVNLNTKH